MLALLVLSDTLSWMLDYFASWYIALLAVVVGLRVAQGVLGMQVSKDITKLNTLFVFSCILLVIDVADKLLTLSSSDGGTVSMASLAWSIGYFTSAYNLKKRLKGSQQ